MMYLFKNRPNIQKIINLLVLVVLLISLAFGMTPKAQAGIPMPLIVTNLNDDGPGSLRYLIDTAVEGSTIVFDSSLSGTIALTRELYIQKSLNIYGPGPEVISVSGEGVTNVFRIIRDRNVTISGLTITKGAGSKYPGGGVANDGTLHLTNVVVSLNTASTFGGGIYNAETGTMTILQSKVTQNEALGYGELAGGGGIWNDGQLTLNYVYVAGNKAPVAGGGIYNDITGQLEVNYSQVNENYIYGVQNSYAWGGGIYNQADYTVDPAIIGEAIIRFSSILGNIADGIWSSGGGVSNLGLMTLANVTISYNSANGVGGGVDNMGSMEIYQSTISQNSAYGGYGDGGGIETSGTLTILQSTIANNTATGYGGGIDKWIGQTWIINSTISGNSSNKDGGGIYHYAHPTEITNSTIVNNTADAEGDGMGSGGGLFNYNEQDPTPKPEGATVTAAAVEWLPTYLNMQNAILATNVDTGGEANDCGVDQGGTITSLGNNLIQDLTGCVIDGAATDDIYNTDPELYALANNGGPTLTHHPMIGSPVLDKANPSACPETDQRGAIRPADGDNNGTSVCDIGSVEGVLGPSGNNWAPFANPQTVYTLEDNPLDILLTGADPEGDPITFTIVSNPMHGSLVGTPPAVTYSPDQDFYGTDSFTFKVKDSQNGESTAVVVINVLSVNDAPAVNAGPDKVVIEGFAVTLNGSYVDVDEAAPPYILWDFGDGTTEEGNLTPTHTYPDDGTYIATLYVVDSFGAVGYDTAVVIVEPRAELSLTKTPSDDPALSGAPLVYTLTVSNKGPSTATNVVVTDNLSEDLDFVSASPGCTFIPDTLSEGIPGKVECQIASVPVGGSVSVEIVTRIPDNFSGKVANNASVAGREHDTNTADDSTSTISDIEKTLAFYCADFESGIGNEWSKTTLSSTPSGRNFLGELSNENLTLNLTGLPAHTQIQVLFDLYLIRSWDGNQLYLSNGEKIGPDRWTMKIDGVEQLTTTFTNWISLGYRQAFPGIYPYGDYPAKFASAESNTLGYMLNGTPMDSVYKMSYAKAHTADSFTLDLSAYGLQPIEDESWGVDNVCVYVAYSQPLLSNILFIPMARK
jgi:uncharacterized repeat protein (TIGR01451 family)